MESIAPLAKKPRTKPKVQKDWDEEDVFKLISLVESEACLWNASDDGYHNKIFRDNAGVSDRSSFNNFEQHPSSLRRPTHSRTHTLSFFFSLTFLPPLPKLSPMPLHSIKEENFLLRASLGNF